MNLQNLNVVELSAQEVQETEGGNPLIWAVIGWFVYETLDDFTDNMKNAQNGYEDATS